MARSFCSVSKTVVTSEVVAVAAEVSSRSTIESHVSDGQHVTFPNHFQVPEALKSGLTFGSFVVTFGSKVESVSFGADDNIGAAESSEGSEEASKESSPRLVKTFAFYLFLLFSSMV